MRKFAALVLLLSLFIVSSISTPAQSRARRVGQSAPPPPVSQPEPSRQPKSGGTADDVGATSRRNGTTAPAEDESEEVGDDEVVRVNTALVTIPVSVMDRDGRYVSNIDRGEFRIYEDGVEQEIAYFGTVEKPFTVALVLDTSNSTAFKLEDIHEAAIAFVNQLRSDDRVMVVSFDDKVRVLSEPTSDRNTLRNAIRRARTGGSTRLYDAVDFVIKQRFQHIDGRKAMVLFTDGVDTTSQRASFESTSRDAEELDAIIYPVQYDTYREMAGGNGGGGTTWPGRSRVPNIGIGRFPFPLPFPLPGGGTIGSGRGGGSGGVGTTRAEYERANRYLHTLSDRTGGRVYEAYDLRFLSQAFASIAEELRRQYSIGYYPKRQSQVSERRQVKVRVFRPNLAVRARDNYIYKPSGGGSPANAQDNSPRQQPAPELRKRQFIANRSGATMRDE